MYLASLVKLTVSVLVLATPRSEKEENSNFTILLNNEYY